MNDPGAEAVEAAKSDLLIRGEGNHRTRSPSTSGLLIVRSWRQPIENCTACEDIPPPLTPSTTTTVWQAPNPVSHHHHLPSSGVRSRSLVIGRNHICRFTHAALRHQPSEILIFCRGFTVSRQHWINYYSRFKAYIFPWTRIKNGLEIRV